MTHNENEFELFKIGDKVRVIDAPIHKFPEQICEIMQIINVPDREIHYDSETGEGGVGHPQIIILKEHYAKISGKLLRKVDQ